VSITEQTPAMTAGKDTRVILRCLYGGGNRVLAIMPDIPGAKEGEFACFTIATRFGVTNYKKIMKESFEAHMEDQEVIDTLCDLRFEGISPRIVTSVRKRLEVPLAS
jgi:hypothetical protein